MQNHHLSLFIFTTAYVYNEHFPQVLCVAFLCFD